MCNTSSSFDQDPCDLFADEDEPAADEDEPAADEDEDGWMSDNSDDGVFWDKDDLRHDVFRFAQDADEDAQDEPTERGSRSKEASYQFCPPAHPLSILRLFKHASQHPLLAERHGQSRSSELIRRDAVNEMYVSSL